MKLPCNIPAPRRQAGIMLIECLVYISVFAILLGLATGTFYFCWDHTRAVVYATDQIESAVRAGERWRADIRNATGAIAVEASDDGETVHIPEAGKEILYRFKAGEIRRQTASASFSEVLLPAVTHSSVKTDPRGEINAWRWDVELKPRRKETHLPLKFTFEAVQPKS